MFDGRLTPAKRPTLRDVAAEAGVSIQTVSNVIHGRLEQMSATTQERVRSAMTALDYTIDRRASALRSGVTRTLAFLVLDEHAAFLADPLTAMIIAGVGDVARDNDYALLIQGAKPSSDGRQLLASLLDRRVDGAIVQLSGAVAVRRNLVERMHDAGLPLILMDELPEIGPVSVVRAEQRAGARKMTEHLLERGHRRIAFVGPKVPWAVIEQRLAGYRDALRAARLPADDELVRLEAEGYDSAQSHQVHALMSLSVAPTAILCSSDLVALGVMKELREGQRSVPRDVAVAGFDNFGFASEVTPSLTTVAVPGFEMGMRAAELLLHQIESNHSAPVDLLLPTQLLIRDST